MKLYLLDGPLMTTCDRKKAMIERMAKDLVRERAYANDRDAMRLLYHLGYGDLNVPLLVGPARALAIQEIVAAEMMKP